MECCIRCPGLNNGLGSVGLQREGKAANKCSAHVGTPSRMFSKAFQVKLVERMPKVCRAVFKAKGGYFEIKIYFDLFNTFLVIT